MIAAVPTMLSLAVVGIALPSMRSVAHPCHADIAITLPTCHASHLQMVSSWFDAGERLIGAPPAGPSDTVPFRDSSLLADMVTQLKSCPGSFLYGLADSCLVKLKPEIRTAFDAADSNGDNLINEAELGALLASVGDKMTDAEVAQLFEKADTTEVWDKDAGVNRKVRNGTISFAQYYELMIGAAFALREARRVGADGGGGIGLSFPSFLNKK